MIIYNVTVKVEAEIAREWVNWMKTDHMPELMSTGLFTDARLCRLLEQDELEAVTYSAQYTCNSIAEYNTYIGEYAPVMRDKSFRRFGNRFIAFRTIMEVEE
ncbi:DUF4286 family protein [Chitinophagaceae bacterium MMS25-I14]